jgi:O-antigen/teichoic acid export membrane protein
VPPELTTSQSNGPSNDDAPLSWQPFAQFREVLGNESVEFGAKPSAIFVPSPGRLIVSSPSSSERPVQTETTKESLPAAFSTLPRAEGTMLPGAEGTSAVGDLAALESLVTVGEARAPIREATRPGTFGDLRTKLAENAGDSGSVVVESGGPSRLNVDSRGPWTNRVAVPNSAASSEGPLAPSASAVEGRSAVKNATTLGASLVVTTAIGFVVSLFYQVRLEPAASGRVAAAEGMTATTLVVLAFGLDNYARKEVALRPSHAREFVPGAMFARLLATVPVTAIVMAIMSLLGRSREVVVLIALFGLVRFLVQSNELLAACLHAVGSVKGLSKQNLVTKVVWGVAIVAFLLFGAGAYAVPLGWIAGETLKLLGLARRAGNELHVWSQIRHQQVFPVLRRSMPFLSSSVLTSLAMVLDITMMQFLANDRELGYYRFAQSLLLIVLIVATVLPWVLLPMASKAAGRSAADLADVMRRSVGGVMALAIPLCVLLSLNADTIIETARQSYVPSIPALRILAITVIGTYLTMVCATFLQAQGKTWVGVRIGVVIVGIDAVLVLLFVPMGLRRFGEGGAGTTAALAILVAEFIGTALFVWYLGPTAWDRDSLLLVGRVLLGTVPVVLADRILAAKGFSFVRGFADVIMYGLNLTLLGVLDPAKIRSAFAKVRSS